MNTLFFILFNVTFTPCFLLIAAFLIEKLIKKYISAFFSEKKKKVKRTAEIRRIIDEYGED